MSVLQAVAVLFALAVAAGVLVLAVVLGTGRAPARAPRRLGLGLFFLAAATAGLAEVGRHQADALVRAASEAGATTTAVEALFLSTSTALAVLVLLTVAGLAATGFGLRRSLDVRRGGLAALPLLAPLIAALGARALLDRASRGLDEVLAGDPMRVAPELARRAETLSGQLDPLSWLGLGLAVLGGVVTLLVLAPHRHRLAPLARGLLPAALIGSLLVLAPSVRVRRERATPWPSGLRWTWGAYELDPMPTDFFEPPSPPRPSRFVVRVDARGATVAGLPLDPPADRVGDLRKIQDAMGSFDGQLVLEVDRSADPAALAALVAPLRNYGYHDVELVLGRPTTETRPLFGALPMIRGGSLRVRTATTAEAERIRIEGELETVFAAIAGARRAGRPVQLLGP